MKACKILKPGSIEILDIDEPNVILPNDVKIKIKIAGICGSDLHNLDGSSRGISYPIIPCHEACGEVVDIGCEVKTLKLGDHVVIDPVTACGSCYPCSIGRRNVCENLKAKSSHIDGCLAQYVVFKEEDVHKVSSHIPWEQAALIEPFTIAGQATSKANVNNTDVVYIVGAGPIGICLTVVCKLLGAVVIISDYYDSRLELAKEAGADYIINVSKVEPVDTIRRIKEIHGVTVVMDGVGSSEVLEGILEVILPAGRIVSLSFNNEPAAITPAIITKKEVTIYGSRMTVDQFPYIINLFEKNEIDGALLISKIYEFDNLFEAFSEAINNPQGNCKILIRL